MRRLRVKPITVSVHPNLYAKMEVIRKDYRDKLGINLSQMDLTNIIATRTRPIITKRLDIIGGFNAKTKKSRPY
jgi:thermostable 8-oxoguanine DNA glycosylase